MALEFSDHFSLGADAYARFRPQYPPALFARLAALAPSRRCCWDVATGTGQAAQGLADHFDAVVATDASASQLARAAAHPRIDYRVELAERSSLADASVDLITVAAGLHWLALPAFYAEVRRVARPGAVIAAWSYDAAIALDERLDAIVRRHVDEVLGPYWPGGYRHVRAAYRTLDFPFAPIELPPAAITVECTLADVVGFVDTLSASAVYRAETGGDPSEALREALAAAWGDAPTRAATLPLFFRVGRVHASPRPQQRPGEAMRTTIQRPTISLELAHALIAAAQAKGAEIGLPVAVTVVDESGVLKAFSRMDGAALISVTTSRKKALTAVGFGLPTGEAWHSFIKDDPILFHGAQQLDDFILLGGGLPIVIDGALVGAIGVSGGHYDKDEACARAAVAILETPA